jgi:phospholipid/cholesterol/gamma-HCH transport system substrate-binding protein
LETRANFLLVGLFVAATLAMAARFAWFVFDPVATAETIYYEIALSKPVASVVPGDPIYFNGLRVGAIVKAPFSADAAGPVVMLARIDRAAPIRANTRAKLELTSLMGATTISLEGVAEDAPPLQALPGQPYPRIAVESGTGKRVDFSEVGNRFFDLLDNARSTFAGVPGSMSTISWYLDTVADVLQPLRQEGGQPSGTRTGVKALERSTDQLARVLATAQSVVNSRNVSNLERLSLAAKESSRTDLRKLERLAVDLRQKIDALDRKARDLQLTPPAP